MLGEKIGRHETGRPGADNDRLLGQGLLAGRGQFKGRLNVKIGRDRRRAAPRAGHQQ